MKKNYKPVLVIVAVAAMFAGIGILMDQGKSGSASSTTTTVIADPQKQCVNNATAWIDYLSANLVVNGRDWINTVGTQNPVYAPIIQDTATAEERMSQVGQFQASTEIVNTVRTQCQGWTSKGLFVPSSPSN